MKTLLRLLIVGLCVCSLNAAQHERRPNIIFVPADDLGYGGIGPFGQTIIRTPNGRLAAVRVLERPDPVDEVAGWRLGRRLKEGSFPQFLVGLLELRLGVHHDRAVPRDGLLEGLARDQKEAEAVVPRLHHDVVAAIKQHQ